MNVRLEIEGLRALAVIAVILFHAGASFIPGGYLGVDVFFVISGFLITRNIAEEKERGLFTLRGFYWKRVMRLFPACAATILVTLLLGSIILPPDEVIQLGRSAIAAVFGVSNIFFWGQVGYFDSDAHFKPLLHTWSLGVEEQFYLVWSICVSVGLPMLQRVGMLWLIIAAASASLGAATIIVNHDPSAVFYLAPFRIFQFTAGITLALGRPPMPSNKWIKSAIFVAGLSAIIASFALLGSAMPMPQLYSLIPCLGAAAVIYVGADHPVGPILANFLMRYIGRISYSLYLVHWPIASLWTEELFLNAKIVALTFLLGVLQFHLIENPLRRAGRKVGTRTAPAIICVCAALLILCESSFAELTSGLRFRLPIALRNMPSDSEFWAERNSSVRLRTCFLLPGQTFSSFDKPECLSIVPGKKNIIIIGDSLASDLYSAFRQAYPKVHFLQATSGNCFPILDTPNTPGTLADRTCRDMLDFVFNEFLPASHLNAIILEAGWPQWPPAFHDQMSKTIAYLRPFADRVYLAGPPVRFTKNVSTLLFESRAISITSATDYVLSHDFNAANDVLIKRFSEEVEYIDLQKIMCADRCRLFDPDGRRIFLDFAHLTKAGATYLASILESKYPHLIDGVSGN